MPEKSKKEEILLWGLCSCFGVASCKGYVYVCMYVCMCVSASLSIVLPVFNLYFFCSWKPIRVGTYAPTTCPCAQVAGVAQEVDVGELRSFVEGLLSPSCYGNYTPGLGLAVVRDGEVTDCVSIARRES